MDVFVRDSPHKARKRAWEIGSQPSKQSLEHLSLVPWILRSNYIWDSTKWGMGRSVNDAIVGMTILALFAVCSVVCSNPKWDMVQIVVQIIKDPFQLTLCWCSNHMVVGDGSWFRLPKTAHWSSQPVHQWRCSVKTMTMIHHCTK